MGDKRRCFPILEIKTIIQVGDSRAKTAVSSEIRKFIRFEDTIFGVQLVTLGGEETFTWSEGNQLHTKYGILKPDEFANFT